MAYTATSLSLAILELFVNLDGESDPGTLISIEADLPVELAQVERINASSLPAGWERVDNVMLRRIGKEWAQSLRSLALLVPSAVAKGEWNALINPLHPASKRLQIVTIQPFRFDPRMFK